MRIQQAPAKSRTERKKEENKKRIILTAMELFKRQGFDQTTMEQIAGQADVCKGTLYNYFPVKEAILEEHVKEKFQNEHEERIRKLKKMPDTPTRLVWVLQEIVKGILEQNEIFEKHFIYRVKKISSLKREEKNFDGFRLLVAEIIGMGQETGEIRREVPLNLLVGLIEHAFIQIVQKYYRDPESFDLDETVRVCTDLCINGMRSTR
ncbi:MAG: TetR/AcrR family transcriptional regulator [Clostridia bacterium]|jgi:AcrR family transcriptional regulator|nr:TetR/AcrR family transcriptional regulator [Clostridia bacterium]